MTAFPAAAPSPPPALARIREALAREPNNPALRLQLAELLRQGRQRGAAVAELDRLCAEDAVAAETLTAAAVLYRRMNALNRAIRVLRRAVDLKPGDFDAETWLRKYHTESARPWHFPMMNDIARARAYDAAIRRAVGPATHVLEIGTGSGLLSMMAARAGAGRVTTCEMVEVIAETAVEIVRRNGYADRITVIPKASTELVVGVDMPDRADLLISEILGDTLLSEDVLHSTGHARANLLKPGAQMIPCAVSAMTRLVGGEALAQLVSVGMVEGFDLSPFNRFAPMSLPFRMDRSDFSDMSEDLEAFRFDLTRDPPQPEERLLRFRVIQSGTCVGVLQWNRLYLDQETVMENRPTGSFEPSAWRQVLFPLPSPVKLVAGEELSLRVKHNVISLAFAPVAAGR